MWDDLHRFVLGVLLSLGAPRSDAEDIAQEALLAAYLNLDGIQPGKLRPWLAATARNRFVDHLRRQGRHAARLAEQAAAEDVHAPEDPLREALADEQRQRVADTIASLPPGERTLLALRHLLDLPPAEIAGLLGMTPNAVKVGLHRARRRFRERYPMTEE